MERYTDVDLMILDRWEEVTSLMYAFDALLGRMMSVAGVAMQQAATHLNEKGFQAYADVKEPSLSFWKTEWVNRKEDGVYGKIVGFVPDECARQVYPHPTTFLITEDVPSLRIAESVEQFGQAFRAGLSDEQRARWSFDVEMHMNPVGREYSEVSPAARVRLVTEPDELAKVLVAQVEDFMELVPAVDATLKKMTRK